MKQLLRIFAFSNCLIFNLSVQAQKTNEGCKSFRSVVRACFGTRGKWADQSFTALGQ